MYGLGALRGLWITLKNLALPGRMFTVHQYPDRKIGPAGLAKMNETNLVLYSLSNPVEALKSLMGLVSVPDRYPQHPRFRGQEFTWYEQRCTGCASCAKFCPLGIIKIVTEPSGESIEEGGKYGIEVFDIDTGRCMFCGLCVEACPYDALHMGSGFEEGKYTRADLVIDVDQLRDAPKKPSAWSRPQIDKVSNRRLNGEELDWNEVGRHEMPTQSEQEERWAKR